MSRPSALAQRLAPPWAALRDRLTRRAWALWGAVLSWFYAPARTREAGMTTAEYAVGTVAACSFAALLITIVKSPQIKAAVLKLITGALGLGG